MKKLLTALCLLLVGKVAYAQFPPTNVFGLDFTANNAQPVSAAGHLRLRYNSGTGALEESIAGVAYDGVVLLTLAQELTNKTMTGQVVKNGLTASGSVSNNFSGSTGDFAFSTGSISYTGAATKTISLVTTGAGSSVTLTAGAASTWSTSAGALTLDAATTLNLGTSAATSIVVSRAGQTVTNNALSTTFANGLTVSAGTITAPNFLNSSTPTIAAGAGLGSSPTISITGNNSRGKIDFTPGTGTTTGDQWTVTLGSGITCANGVSVQLMPNMNSDDNTAARWNNFTVSMGRGVKYTTTTWTFRTSGNSAGVAATAYSVLYEAGCF